MAYPISVKKNDYNENKKDHVVATPYYLCIKIAEILRQDGLLIPNVVLDVACGDGRLGGIITNYGYKESIEAVYGVDTKPAENNWILQDLITTGDFLTCEMPDINPNLIVCNPPFNNTDNKKVFLPELFLHRMFELYGDHKPIIMFVPFGFRLNQRKKSKRYQSLMNTNANITSIISLPIDAFEDVAFHSEILIFNIPGLKPHYFIDWSGYKTDEEFFEKVL